MEVIFLNKSAGGLSRKGLYFEIFSKIMSTEGAVDNESILAKIFTNCNNKSLFLKTKMKYPLLTEGKNHAFCATGFGLPKNNQDTYKKQSNNGMT